ncbi:gp53-like domain-containing protein [Marinobacter shengliensis]|uniref:gp53-like domain-containing protein n=1 Tax=Marinobacter shengliensis TaxID=1389223 RepID=UPI001E577E02|nr:hypothetical protein [Marinobacter shengliensis]MCD1628446.1 hypothetical protein [Marinobacter shengliensis]
MTPVELKATFNDPAAQILLTASIQSVSAESVIYNKELTTYIESIKATINGSLADIGTVLSVDVTGRLGYRYKVTPLVSASYTLQLVDEGTLLRTDSTQPNTIVVPTDASVNFDLGTIINITQGNTGKTSFSPAPGVVLNSPDALLEVTGQFQGAALIKVGPNEWDLLRSFQGVSLSDVQDFNLAMKEAVDAVEFAYAQMSEELLGHVQVLNDTIENNNLQLTQTVDQLSKQVAAAGTAVQVSDFDSLKDTAGYQKLPGGLIFQWGKINSPVRHSSGDPTTIARFPISFPGACIQVQATHNTPSTYGTNAIYETDIGVHSFDNTQVRFEHYVTGDRKGSMASFTIYWFAIGY